MHFQEPSFEKLQHFLVSASGSRCADDGLLAEEAWPVAFVHEIFGEVLHQSSDCEGAYRRSENHRVALIHPLGNWPNFREIGTGVLANGDTV